MIPRTFQKMNLSLIFTFYDKYLSIKIVYNLLNKTLFCLKWNRINGFVRVKKTTEKWNSQHEHSQPTEQTIGLFCTWDSGVARCQSQHQSNEFHVRSVLHGQVSLAAVDQIFAIHETMNGCKNLKIHKRLALKI